MKTTTFFALSAALFGLAAAAPVHKRDIVVQTVTSEVVTTVEITTTIWVDPPTATPSPDVEPAEFFESPAPTPEEETPAPSSSSSPPAAPPAPSSATEAPAVPTPEAPAAPITTPAPEPVVESPPPQEEPETPETPAPQPETPAPAPQPETPAPQPQTPTPQPEAPSNNGGGQGQYTGDLTHYTPGMGSCGFTNGESDWIVAVSHSLFDRTTPNGNPNKNPICGKSINIFFGGKTFSATVADRCAGCAKEGDLDMPQDMFNAVTGGTGDGRVTQGMSWSFA